MIFKQCAIAKLNKSFFAGYNTDRIARFWMIIRICNQKCVTELAKKLVSVKKMSKWQNGNASSLMLKLQKIDAYYGRNVRPIGRKIYFDATFSDLKGFYYIIESST